MDDKNNKKIIIIAVVTVLVISVIGLLLIKGNEESIDTNRVVDGGVFTEVIEFESEDIEESGDVQVFNIVAIPYEFSIKEIRVKEGDVVRINLITEAGFHDWVIDEFSVKTRQLSAGQSDSIEFVADKKGIFEYYCSVANHRQLGMVGNLIVE